MSVQKENVTEEMPWLVFKLCGQMYALNSFIVKSIFCLDREITPMPESQENIRGVIQLHGEIIPAIDLRGVLGLDSFAEQHRRFSELLDERKKDHIHWVDELERCVKEQDVFTLTTDPHQCAFGKWYDHYETNDPNVRFYLKKIAAPHQKLHETAIEIFSKNEEEEPQKKKRVAELMKEEKEVLMPEVLGLLDQIKDVLKESYREMCIVVSNGDMVLGLLVDEVVSVEHLTMIGADSEMLGLDKDSIFTEIAQSSEREGEILVLDSSIFFKEKLGFREA